jgi:pilus assembly protein CpaF
MSADFNERLEKSSADNVETGEVDLSLAYTSQERGWMQTIHQELLDKLDLSLVTALPEDEARQQICEACYHLISESGLPIGGPSRERIVKQIENEVMGLGPLESLLSDDSVADILVNGPKQIYVERHGKLELTDVAFNDNTHLRNIIDRIVSSVGRRVDESSPMVDARLKDGSRVNVIIPPLALDGASMSIRRFTVERLDMEHLVNIGSVPPMAAALLEGIVKARLNVLISGGTGSGKTTMLNILSGFIPENERIITIEDSAELQLQQPHVVRLETRPPNIEGKGEITQRNLVRNSLRMRPERIVIGEVRGGEAFDMLQAMNTGHDGSLATTHANSPRDALVRIENMVTMAGINFPLKTIRAQVASAVDVVIQVERLEDGKRRLTSIQEVAGMEGDIITLSELMKYQRLGMDEEGNVRGKHKATGIIPGFYDRLVKRGIDIPRAVFNPDSEWGEE